MGSAGMHSSDVRAMNFRQREAADRWQNIKAQQRFVALMSSLLALGRDVGSHELACDFAEERDRALFAPRGDRVGARFDQAEEFFGLASSLFRRQPPMLANSRASGAASLPVLGDVNLFAGRKGTDAEARNSVIP